MDIFADGSAFRRGVFYGLSLLAIARDFPPRELRTAYVL